MADYWDEDSCSWTIIFCRLLKNEEIIDFQNLLGQISAIRPSENYDERCGL